MNSTLKPSGMAEADLLAAETRATRGRLDPDGVFASYLGPRTDLAAPARPALRDEASLR